MWTLDEKNIDNYEIVKTTTVKEENLDIVEILHKKTKCKIVLMICDDKNRVFNIAFKTPVENSKGIPHILEHSVLCGSKKYNVKDPFIELAKTSVNTFLNAMTFPDKTCYPVASANLKDFHNLSHVYLDAVFYPNAIKDDKIFKQEGWHYEIDSLSDELKVNGVVLNEMRGVYSNPDEILEYAILKNTFNGTNYAYDYGGNPDEIINLTFEEFKDFHKKYYSPSNAIIYYYGELDYNDELQYLNDEYLKNFDYIDIKPEFQDVENFVKDNVMKTYYNVDDEDNNDNAYIAYSFATGTQTTTREKIVIKILDYVLFLSDSAILKNEFMKEGFGESVTSFYESGLKNGIYSIIAKNIDDKKCEEFVEKILKSIQRLIDEGIDTKKLEAGINSLYFSCVENEYQRIPSGLIFSLMSLETYLYGRDVDAYIKYEKEFEYLKSIDLNDKNNIFYSTLKKLFIENNHRSINVLLPKNGLILENDKKLKELLKKKKENLSEKELLGIINDCKTLKDFQSKGDNEKGLVSIPTLSINDLEEGEEVINYECSNLNDIETILDYDNDKNIIYMSFGIDITNLSKEEIYLTSIINRILSRLDLKSMSYSEFDSYVDINTGGLNVKYDLFNEKALFTIATKMLPEKCDVAFEIIYKLITESVFVDKSRIYMLLNEQKANAITSILSSGHLTAIDRSLSNISFSHSISDKISGVGIASYKFLNCFVKEYEKNADLINETLELLYKKLLTKKIYIAMSVNKKYKNDTLDLLSKFCKKIKEDGVRTSFSSDDEIKYNKNIESIKRYIPFDDFEKKVDKEAILVPSDVNFVAVANKFDKNKYKGYMSFLKTLFNYEYLWTNIRVLGGAYGCMSFFTRAGVYAFTSYRDPNLTKTNETFLGIYNYLKNIDISEDRFEKYIIGSTSIFDNPLSTLSKFNVAVSGYFNSLTNDDLRKEREELITMNIDDVKNVAEIFSNMVSASAVAVIGEKVKEDAENTYDLVWKLMD